MILADKNEINRAGIYVFYDKYGIVDEYVFYMLENIRPFLKSLTVVVNGSIQPEYESRLDDIADDIYKRTNNGYDITAYRDGIKRIGWDKLCEYDECILFNSTLYGPIYPFSEMFETMDKKDIDFWGILKFFKQENLYIDDCDYKYIPEHIQSYFISIRNKMLTSKEFFDKMENLPFIEDANDAISQFEVVFTKEFSEYGYKWDTYMQIEDLRGQVDYAMMIMPDELIRERRCPVIKQKLFATKARDYPVFDSVKKALQFIDSDTDYDVNMIWDNLLRTMPMDELKSMLHFNYILQRNTSVKEYKDKKIAMVVNLQDTQYLSLLLKYISNISVVNDIIFVYFDEDKRKESENILIKHKNISVKFIKKDISSEIISANKQILEDYDYLCYINLHTLEKIEPYVNQKLFYEKGFENLIASDEYIYNIIDTFQRENRLGMLIPKQANHAYFSSGEYFPWGAQLKKNMVIPQTDSLPVYYKEYEQDFIDTKQLLEQMNIHVPISLKNAPVSPSDGFFWIKKQATKTIFQFAECNCDDYFAPKRDMNGVFLHIPERIYGYAVQNDGFYTGYIMNDDFAAIEMTNQDREVIYLAKTMCIKKVSHAALAANKVTSTVKEGLKIVMPKEKFRKLLKWKRKHLGS